MTSHSSLKTGCLEQNCSLESNTPSRELFPRLHEAENSLPCYISAP